MENVEKQEENLRNKTRIPTYNKKETVEDEKEEIEEDQNPYL